MLRLLDIHPNVKHIGMYSANVDNKDNQLLIVIDGVNYTLSVKLTEAVRSGKVKIDELGEYIVRDVEGKDGTTFKSLGYAGEDIQVKVTGWKASGVTTAKVITPETFMSFSSNVKELEELAAE